MAWLAIALYAVFGALAFGFRMVLQLRRTGSTGLKGVSGDAGSLEWLGGVLFIAGIALGVAAPILDLTDVLDPIAALDGDVGHAVGLVLAVAGIGLTLYAQIAMGDAWRIGVDEGERTDLVTDGPFGLVRNPIYAAMLPTVTGIALLVPNVAAVAGLITLIVALELQTRAVEEPYLLRVHGRAYADYAAHTGRFLPGVGRVRNS
jgi:protein-S-isoprenylcysteine O-methyltransferase Ste14